MQAKAKELKHAQGATAAGKGQSFATTLHGKLGVQEVRTGQEQRIDFDLGLGALWLCLPLKSK